MNKNRIVSRNSWLKVKVLVAVIMICCPSLITGASRRDLNNSSSSSSETASFLETDPERNNVRKFISEVRKDVKLQCPSPHRTFHQQIEWYKQNPNGVGKKRITQFRGRYELSSLGVITIKSAIEEDRGTYICKLAHHSDLYYIELEVTGKGSSKSNHVKTSTSRRAEDQDVYSEPQISTELLPKEKITHVSKGHPMLLLKCESTGYPQPTITWYKDGNVVSSSTTNASKVRLFNVSQSDSGRYKCESVNLFGVSTYEVTIQVTDVWFGAAEILELTPRNVTVSEGATVNISCVARFEMNPWLFTWVRKMPNNETENDKIFFHSGTSAFYQVLRSTVIKDHGGNIYSTELILTNVTQSDGGVYFCAVAGRQGYNLSDVTVVVTPDPVIGKNVAAQWAILWTISFLLLVMLVILCSVRLYGCRPAKLKRTLVPSSTGKSHCHLPESSPLTMSTQCTTHESSCVPLTVGGGQSASGLSHSACGFESDCESASASTYGLTTHHVHCPSASCVSSACSTEFCCNASASFRPNSLCSDYHPCGSSASKYARVHYPEETVQPKYQRHVYKMTSPINRSSLGSSYGCSSSECESYCSSEVNSNRIRSFTTPIPI